MAVDSSGNVYVADYYNYRIRKITPQGRVSTFAGTGGTGSSNGPGNQATFRDPSGVAVDSSGNVYVADSDNWQIRKITPEGVVSLLAGRSNPMPGFRDGAGDQARFRLPVGVAVDLSGNVYVADKDNHRIRKVTPTGAVSTIAGDGQWGYSDSGSEHYYRPSGWRPWAWKKRSIPVRFNSPRGVAVSSVGSIYVADTYNNRIRKINSDRSVHTIADRGVAVRLKRPKGIAVDSLGSLYVADSGNHRILKFTPGGGVSVIAGDGTAGFRDGTGDQARFNSPTGVAVDSSDNVYVADSNNNRIRKIIRR